MNRRPRAYTITPFRVLGILFVIACILLLAIRYPEPADAAHKTCNPGDAPIYSVSVQRFGSYYVTGYNALDRSQCKRGDGITASGVAAVAGRTVAMRGLKFGTHIYIENMGSFVVEDRGVGRRVVDVACETRAECFAITGRREVYIIKYL